jgi:hypothetical protein
MLCDRAVPTILRGWMFGGHAIVRLAPPVGFAHPTNFVFRRHCEEPPGLACGEPEGRLRDEAIQGFGNDS